MNTTARPWNYARIDRSCIQCAAPFSCSPSRKTQHCSDACARKTQQAKLLRSSVVQRPCVVCDIMFALKENTRMRTTCSAECRKKSMLGVAPPNKLPVKTATCKECGVVFQFPGSSSERSYCTISCHNDSMIGQRPWNYEPEIVKICQECGINFTVFKSQDRRIYCSRDCQHVAKAKIVGNEHPLYKERVTRTCDYCGVIFESHSCYNRKFCSRGCVGAASTRTQGGRRSSIELLVEAELIRLGEVFESSKPVGHWLLDFFLPDRKLVLECDGDYWHSIPEVAARDLRKDTWLRQHGYEVVRLSENDIRENVIVAVAQGIDGNCRCTEGLA